MPSESQAKPIKLGRQRRCYKVEPDSQTDNQTSGTRESRLKETLAHRRYSCRVEEVAGVDG
eukprot:CAMPEP_0194754436 /NCGR_PEP_ID=MMETSP0323_2-20130528/8413_1 /TAXON_ID=2866 ORGANISM="Crypthecodinium cohnii, Strain Seligo" /NCGR_SAMPLE_ID=MMETSP0323_2 /ASSEMBLY_ACC=CAM_ASM_000346 /LENGTH=60 /DNA_ID=CAMNT_0039672973 /DNA_START=177 /DNA_END=359 /DNA_ORIENTATION=-